MRSTAIAAEQDLVNSAYTVHSAGRLVRSKFSETGQDLQARHVVEGTGEMGHESTTHGLTFGLTGQ